MPAVFANDHRERHSALIAEELLGIVDLFDARCANTGCGDSPRGNRLDGVRQTLRPVQDGNLARVAFTLDLLQSPPGTTWHPILGRILKPGSADAIGRPVGDRTRQQTKLESGAHLGQLGRHPVQQRFAEVGVFPTMPQDQKAGLIRCASSIQPAIAKLIGNL